MEPLLSYEERGPADADAVLLLHGFPLHRGMWTAVAEALAAAGHRVILPDLRGHGDSAASEDGSMTAMAEDVLALAHHLGLQRFVLGGFSMGGYVALEVARRAPQRLRGLVLVDTRTGADDEAARRGRKDTAAMVRREGMRALADAMLPKLLAKRHLEQHPDLVAAVRAMILENPVDGAVAALSGMAVRRDQADTLKAYGGPVLVLVGKEDTITPVEEAESMVATAERAGLEVIEGAAHLVPLERAPECAAAVAQWLTAVPEAATRTA